jgi:hypothetical protein
MDPIQKNIAAGKYKTALPYPKRVPMPHLGHEKSAHVGVHNKRVWAIHGVKHRIDAPLAVVKRTSR